jgi:uncharacterized protein YbjT (DUF2867 family)
MAQALIAGASGLIGGFLLRELLAAREYSGVTAVGRRPVDEADPKLRQVTVDFSALEKAGDDLRADDVFCCLGTTIRAAGSHEAFRAVDHGAVLALAWAAQRAGARRFFLVSSLGADAGTRSFYLRVKGETEDALGVLGFDVLNIFRPSLLLGPRREFRLGERLAQVGMWLADPLLLGRFRKYRAIEAATVARAMLRISFARGERGVRVFESDEIEDLGRFAPEASIGSPASPRAGG